MRFSKCAFQTSCSSSTWRLAGNANARAPALIHWIRNSGGGPSKIGFHTPFRGFWSSSNQRIMSLDYYHFASHTPSPGCQKLLFRTSSLHLLLPWGIIPRPSILPSLPWRTQMSDLYLEFTSPRRHCLDCPDWIQYSRALCISLLRIPSHVRLVGLNYLFP